MSRIMRSERWLPIALFLFSLGLYAPSLFNGLTSWGDPLLITSKPFSTTDGLLTALTASRDGSYAPLTHMVLGLWGLVFDANPLAFHALPWFLFAIGVALLPRALALFDVTPLVSGIAVVLWVAHPFRVESVTWAANVSDALALAFATAAFALYGLGRRTSAAILLPLAVLAEPSFAPVGIVLGVLDWRLRKAGALIFVLPALALGVLASVLTGATSPIAETGWANAFVTPLWYLGRQLWPTGSRVVYDWRLPALFDSLTALSFVAWCLVGGLAWAARGRPALRPFVVGALVTLLLLAPLSGISSAAAPVVERATFLSALPLMVLVAWLLSLLTPSIRWGVVLALLAPLATLTVLRQREWRDSLTLWASNVALAPNVYVARYNYAGALGGAGRFADAYQQLLEARSLDPRGRRIDCQLALARAGREKLDEQFTLEELPRLCLASPDEKWAAARRYFARRDPRARIIVEELDMGDHRAQGAAASGALALNQGDADSALALARVALEWEPTLEQAQVTQALALIQLGRLDDALLMTNRTFIDPKVAARMMGIQAAVLFKKGATDDAAKLLAESVRRLRALGESIPVGP